MSKRKQSDNVGLRQLQKRAKQESDALLQDVSQDEIDWLLEGDEVRSPCEDVTDDSTAGPSAQSDLIDVGGDSEYQKNVVIVKPTDLSGLFSDEEYTSSSSDEEEDKEPLAFCLRRWYVESKVNLKQLGSLLKELQPLHPELPSDPRTIAETPRETPVKYLLSGNYVHFGLEQGLRDRLKFGTVDDTTKLGVDINIDAIPLFKSGAEARPILGRSLNLKDSRPFAIGCYSGTGKPKPLKDYLADYMDEVLKLKSEGLEFNGCHYEVYIRVYICDAPARAYLKCIKGHSGYSACEKCFQEGEHDGKRIIYDLEISALRTDESFLRQDDDEHHHCVSPLVELDTKMVSMFPLDPMHLLLLGVMKRFFNYLVGNLKGANARLTAAQIGKVTSNLLSIVSYICREFARIPRSFESVNRWKATELYQILVYTGPAVLKDSLPQEVYSLFLMVHVAARIVSHPSLVGKASYVDYAEELFSAFVKHCAHPTVFSKSFVVYDEHGLLHLVDDVRKFGTIFNFSAFPFENYLGILKRMVRTGVNITQQLSRRLAEQNRFLSLPPQKPTSLTPCGLRPSKGEYKRLESSSFTLVPLSRKDSFFKIGESAVGRLTKIMKTSSGAKITADVCDTLEDWYSSPIESSKLGIYKLTGWTRRNIELDISIVSGKVMVIPSSHGNMAAELLHPSN